MTTRETIDRRPLDPRCYALVGTSTKYDEIVTRCQGRCVYITDRGEVLPENPGVPGHWSKYDEVHRAEMLDNRAIDKRSAEGNRIYGPQVIMHGQTADPWIDPVEGGKRG